MKRLFFFCLLLLSHIPRTSLANDAAPSVVLHWKEKQIALSEATCQQLSRQAVRLVESSNFHSGPGDQYHLFKLSRVQSNYRREVAGRYLVVSYAKPQKLKSLGGEITVTEVVVALNRDDFASGLYTIDEDGRIIGHDKYAGELCIQIFDTVKQLIQ
jgi:hypothetical protein